MKMNINKMRRPSRFGIWDFGFAIIFASAILASACTNNPPEVKNSASPSPAATSSPASSPSVSPSPAASVAAGKVDSLIGRWAAAGEGSLNVTKKGDKFSVEIADATGPKTFEGTAKGDVIEFTRNGKTETIKPATGAETGVKGFEKETNCVVITKGTEAFCKK